jgi:signal transduction histidine kinase
MNPLGQRLLAFARRLHSIEDFNRMVTATADEIRESIGYNVTWVSVFDLPTRTVRMLAVQGENEDDIWQHAPSFPIDDDPYMARIFDATEPQVVGDAQNDPGVNRQLVEQLGNRTIINVPMRLVDQPFGALGTGTFGDEGVRLPTPEKLDHLVGIAAQLVTAAARLVLAAEREQAARHREEFNRRLLERQRLESLGELAGGVAHDFNNLLTIVMATASMLQRTEPEPRRKADLQTILDASSRAGALTRRLLALGQRQPLQLTNASMNDVVAAVVELLRRVVPADIQIEVFAGDELPLVAMDIGQLEQVIVNLSLNARDAMRAGGRLTFKTESAVLADDFVELHPWSRVGRYVLLTVTDSGQGIPPDVLGRIFEPFFSTKKARGGTGLGLAVCRGIIEQHGGFVHAYSELAVGSSFKIYLPVGGSIAPAALVEGQGPAPGGTERILLADDEELIRRVSSQILEDAGYTIVTAEDGVEAVRAVADGDFDLVILDAVMPNMTGRAAFDAIRKAKPGVRVLFASGYGAEELSARFLSDADAPLLAKPFGPDQLLRTVRALLDS